MTKEDLIQFERKIADEWNTGQYPFLIHLSGGNEDVLLQIFKDVKPEDWVFSTHRNHYHYLLKGGDQDRLYTTILEGRSMFVFDREIRFFSSSIVAGAPAIAVGVAWAIKENKGTETVWCFVGDGAEDNGHFYEAVTFATGHKLPVKFIIEDNDRSVTATKDQRRGDAVETVWPHLQVIRYNYAPTWPHAGSGTKNKIQFKL